MYAELALKPYSKTFGRPEAKQLEDLLKFLERIIAEPFSDWIIAYILATVGNETFHLFKPLEHKDPKLKKYFGRGLIPLRGKPAYERASELLDRNLVKSPDLALDDELAYILATQGLWEGVFTGVPLSSFAGTTGKNLIPARRTVTLEEENRMDRYIEELVERTWLNVVIAAQHGKVYGAKALLKMPTYNGTLMLSSQAATP